MFCSLSEHSAAMDQFVDLFTGLQHRAAKAKLHEQVKRENTIHIDFNDSHVPGLSDGMQRSMSYLYMGGYPSCLILSSQGGGSNGPSPRASLVSSDSWPG